MQILIARTPLDGRHGRHPEVIGIGSHGMNGLLETDLNFETPAIELDDLKGRQEKSGSEEDALAAGGVFYKDKAGMGAAAGQ